MSADRWKSKSGEGDREEDPGVLEGGWGKQEETKGAAGTQSPRRRGALSNEACWRAAVWLVGGLEAFQSVDGCGESRTFVRGVAVHPSMQTKI